MGTLFLVVIPLAPAIFSFAGHSPEVAGYEVQYFQIVSLCAPAMLHFAIGLVVLQRPRADMGADDRRYGHRGAGNLFGLRWIFGNFGFPEWGLAGAAWTTVFGMWLKAIVYLLLPLQRRHRKRFGTISGIRWDGELVRRIMYFGWPSGFQMLLDVTGFTVFIFMLGDLGDVAKQATSLAFSISSLAFMPIYGLHIAVSVLVGERLGENRDDLAARATFTTLQISWMYMLVISLLYALLPELFLAGIFPRRQRDVGGADGGARADGDAVAVRRGVQPAGCDANDSRRHAKGRGRHAVPAAREPGAGDAVGRVQLSQRGRLELDVYGCWTLIVFWCLIAAVTYVDALSAREVAGDAGHRTAGGSRRRVDDGGGRVGWQYRVSDSVTESGGVKSNSARHWYWYSVRSTSYEPTKRAPDFCRGALFRFDAEHCWRSAYSDHQDGVVVEDGGQSEVAVAVVFAPCDRSAGHRRRCRPNRRSPDQQQQSVGIRLFARSRRIRDCRRRVEVKPFEAGEP